MPSTYNGAAGSINSQTDLVGCATGLLDLQRLQLPFDLRFGRLLPLRAADGMARRSALYRGRRDRANHLLDRRRRYGSWQILPSLSVAAGPTLNYSEIDLKEFPGFVNHFRGRATDAGYMAGLLFHPMDQHFFGLTYRSATEMNYNGHATVPIPPFAKNTAASADFHFPATLAGGYSYRPNPKWNFEGDVNWTDWSSLKSVPVIPLPPDTLTFNWSPSWMLDFGVTRYLGDGWRVSGGYMYSMNSVPDANFNPLMPDSDRHIFSLGVGKNCGRFSWDAAYQLGWGPSRSVGGDATAFRAPDGKYRILQPCSHHQLRLPLLTPAPFRRTNRAGTLLIVDDEEGPRQSLRVVFKDDYSLLLASNGPTPSNLARTHKINAAVLDIRMTGMSGTEVLEKLKAIQPSTEVIMLTAYETVDTIRQALRLGACDYLNKPFDVPTIRKAVATAMERHSFADEIRANNEKLGALQIELHDQRLQEEITRTRGEIYASIIHDINGPLTIISGFIQIINQRMGESKRLEGEDMEMVKDRLRRITRQVSNCIEISHRYLSFMRQQHAAPVRINVNLILDDLRELLNVHPSKGANTLKIHTLVQDVELQINGTDLIQILLNLAINALQCSPEPHLVDIAGQVLDTMIGIAGQRQPRNFRGPLFDALHPRDVSRLVLRHGAAPAVHAGEDWPRVQLQNIPEFAVRQFQ